jgi:hypothetical protein
MNRNARVIVSPLFIGLQTSLAIQIYCFLPCGGKQAFLAFGVQFLIMKRGWSLEEMGTNALNRSCNSSGAFAEASVV